MSNALAVYHGPFGRASLYNLNKAMATHAHREGHLAFLVEGKTCSIQVGEDECEVSRDLANAVSPWQPHCFRPGDDGAGTLFLVLYIRQGWFVEVSRRARTALSFGRSRIEVDGRIQALVQRSARLLLDEAPGDRFAGCLSDLTQECFEQSWTRAPDTGAAWHNVPVVRDFRVRNSIRLMGERLGDEIDLDRIARDAGLSRPHFYKLFRQHVGVTPNLYLNTLRMETAIERLTRSDDAITTIGLDLGFASQASFTRFFASNVGIAPTDYRRVAYRQVGHA